MEADTIGEVFATRVGYDAEAYVGLLTRLRDLRGDDRALFKTHPNFSARIEAVQKRYRVSISRRPASCCRSGLLA